ncbi:MAG: GHKL domain-containing protein [Lachnospiraceae bacterium]|nr:GHKL domain-containing protein [Lachnospiraceae bacterium]
MEYYEIVFSLAFNILSLYVNVRVINLFLPRKKETNRIAILIYFMVWILNWLIYYILQIPLITTLSLFLGLIFIVLILYGGNVWKKAIAVVASLALTLIIEEIVWRVLYVGIVDIKSDAIGSLCSSLIALGIIFFVERYICLEGDIQLPDSSYLNIVSMIVGSIFLEELLSNAKVPNQIAMLGLSIICLLNVSTYFLYEKVIDSNREKMQIVVMKQQVKMYANQLDVVKQSQQNLRSMRHDMKNHLLKINSYLQNGKYDEAEAYIEQMEGELEIAKEYVRTGNFEIDSILNYKLGIAENLGCVLKIEVDVPEQKFMSDFDFTILLGNLLDNGIEAIQNSEKKFLNIGIRYIKGILYVGIYNSYNGKLNKRGGKLQSIKRDKKNHGIGLFNIKNIVNKYDGEICINCSESVYKTDIVLYIK